MKVTVYLEKKTEMEIDDKFKTIVADDPDYKPDAPENEALYNELESLFKAQGNEFIWDYEDDVPLGVNLITGVYRTKDGGAIME